MIARMVDRLVAVFSPHTALRRQHARKVMRGYQGGEAHRLNANRQPKNQAADSELLGPYGADSLRAWSRMLVRDNAYAWGVVDTIVASVIGPGIQVESMCEHNGEDDDKINAQRNKIWSEWTENCDVTGQYTFDELQSIIQREIVEAGEVLVHRVFQKSKKVDGIYRPVPYALEIIEADRLASDKDTYMIQRENKLKIIRGVELNEVGKPVAYWVYPDHPNAPYTFADRTPVRIEADKILHLFRRDRVGQSRGVTWFAPVVSWLRDLATYTDNELQASAVASCFTVAIKTEGPVQGLSPPSSDDEVADAAGNQYDYLQPGMIMRLGKNESIDSANPGRPNSAAGPWINLMLRGIAVGVGLSYETVARDYSQTTYSSNRSSQLEDRRRFRRWQKYLINHLLQPVWDDFCTAAARDGNKAFPSMADLLDDRRLHSCVEFQAQRWEWVDPGVEQSSSEASIKAFQTTYQDELAGKGANWRRVFKQRAKEEKLLKKLNLVSPAQEAEAEAGAKVKTADAAMVGAKQAAAPNNGAPSPKPNPGKPEGAPEGDAKKSPPILQGRSDSQENAFWEAIARRLDPTLPQISRHTPFVQEVMDAQAVQSDVRRDQPDDCGTGAGGFKPGNECAGGGGSAPWGTHEEVLDYLGIKDESPNEHKGWGPRPEDTEDDKKAIAKALKRANRVMDIAMEGGHGKQFPPEVREAYEKMSDPEQAIMGHYTMSGYGRINKSLRKGDVGKVDEVLVKLMDSALEDAPKVQETVYRLVGSTVRTQLMKEGSVFSDAAYSSASLDIDITRNFRRTDVTDVIIQYEGDHGGREIPSAQSGEMEVVIPRGREFRVTNVIRGSEESDSGEDLTVVIVEPVKKESDK